MIRNSLVSFFYPKRQMIPDIEFISSLTEGMKKGSVISDTILQRLYLYCILTLELRDLCVSMMETPSLTVNDQEIIQHYATELYNCCRETYRSASTNGLSDRKCSIALTRYYACSLLDCTFMSAIALNHSPMTIISTAPDLLRAYKSSSLCLKECGCDEEFTNCFMHALRIIDKIEPHLPQCENGSSFFAYKETEYDVLMEWLGVLIPSKQPESCFAILTKIRDDCVKYLPDIKLSFVKQSYMHIPSSLLV